MKIKLLTILISLTLSVCMKANLNNIADPNKGSGIFYAYSLVPMALTGSQEVIPVAIATSVDNLPTSIDNGTTINNIEVKFNKDIEEDSTITVRSTDPMLKVNGLDEVTFTFTKANARVPQIVALSASSESLADVGVILEFESPLASKIQKVVIVKNSLNGQVLIVKNDQDITLVSGATVNTMPGDQFIYKVTLKYKPTENVTIGISRDTYPGAPTIDKTQLIFTPQNYNVPQTYTVTMPPVSDTLPVETYIRSYNVTATLEYFKYFGVNYTQQVNPTITVTGPTNFNKGAVSNLGVSLSHKPDTNRTVTVTINPSKYLSFDKTTFTFTPANYNTPQPIKVTVSSQDYIFSEDIIATFTTTGGYRDNPFKIRINDTSNFYLDYSDPTFVNFSGHSPSIAIDTLNSKLLIAKTFSSDEYSKLRLSICNLDGSSCSTKEVSDLAGFGNGSGNNPSMVVDTVNSKILIAIENYANNRKPSLYRCELDGSSCTHHDLSAGRGDKSGMSPKLLIDTLNNKILLLTRNSETGPGFIDRLSLFRCNLDATNCTFTDISAGKGNYSTFGVSRIASGIDYTNLKLLAVTTNNFQTDFRRPSLFRCDLDGSNCTFTDISTGQGNSSGINPSLVIDSVNKKFFTTTVGHVFKCELDGTSCIQLSLPYAGGGGSSNTILLDQVNSKILIASTYMTLGTWLYPGIYRCSLNLTNCSWNSLALTGQMASRDFTVRIIDLVFDEISTTPRILVVVAGYNYKSHLVRILRNYVD